MEYFRDTVFNYPTLAECYKVAALAALNKFSNNGCPIGAPSDTESSHLDAR